ncbi:tetratricopeptide repeat protein [Paenibacillus taihuensis]|uniref:Tetratricopeptide repeat protein n=1 Tax=Paenibacillus taihuensis TaxID=1156355 RepID=A0A3D9S6M8_9BACL|nr:glycosyltransferase family 2 protein [Paenibacillus taihuensis]REE84485.1 tetratricopeptide repeat protein [Paenibacillus taihuensis]
MLVSVCMIVRNEEANLERALNSIPASYEKVVVDTGSTDTTVEIAQRLGAKVARFTWVDDFAAARNYSISQAAGQYILIMDADEALDHGIENRIEQFIASDPHSAAAITIITMINDETHKHRMVRFFPNKHAYQFYGIVHEMLYYNGQPAPFQASEMTIYHYGYQEEQYADGSKVHKYVELYNKHLVQNPKDGYMLYQLGKLYYSNKELDKALDAFERCLAVNEPEQLYYPVMLVMLGYSLKEIGQSALAEELLSAVQTEYPQFPDLPFLLGLLAMDTGKVADIESHFLKALAIGDTSKYTSVDGVGSYKAAYNLAVYYEITGGKAKAIQYYRTSAAANYAPARERLNQLALN